MAKKEVGLKCDSCGGLYKYDSASVALKCASCGKKVPIDVSPAIEIKYEEGLAKENANNWQSFTHSYRCDSCGAVQILNNANFADICPFCGSPNIADIENTNGLTPNAILPFKLNEEQARQKIFDEIKKSFWAPKSLYKNIALNKIKGVYTPCYTFDFKIDGTYTGRLGKSTERTIRMKSGEFQQINEIKWFNVSGSINEVFNDVVIDAGQKITSPVLMRIEPYATDGALNFNKSFMCGYIANQASKSLMTARNQAEHNAQQDIKEKIKRINNAQYIEYINLETSLSNIKFKYIMLPVYVTSFDYGGKNYKQYINGTTGKAFLKIPKSRAKMWGIFAIIVTTATTAVLIAKFVFNLL